MAKPEKSSAKAPDKAPHKPPRSSRSPETSGRATTTTFSRRGKPGLVLTGTEVKSLREGRANISDAYGIITDGEVFLLNLHISQYERGGYTNHEPARTRKLLLHRKEIRRLIGAVERQGLTLVPLELYFKNGVAKVALALGKGKKLHDKRDTERTRDAEREMARVVREPMIAPFAVALQLAAATPALVVRDARPYRADPDRRVCRRPDASSRVARDPCFRSKSIATAGSTYTLDVWGVRLQLEPGVSVVRVGNDVRPLATAPRVQDGHLLVPLQLVSEVFPDVVPNMRWDAETSQLVVFSPQASVGARSAAPSRDGGEAPRAPTSCRRSWTVACRRCAPSGGAGEAASVHDHRRRRPRRRRQRHDRPARRRTEDLREGHHARRGEPSSATSSSRAASTSSTRAPRDTLIALDDRGTIANRAAGNLFISIHVNAANPNWKDPRGCARVRDVLSVRGENRGRAPRGADGKRRRASSRRARTRSTRTIR